MLYLCNDNFHNICMKARILKTAGELFFKFGIRSVSIDEICNELHISKKTFYTIFKQKDELVTELLNTMSQKQEKDFNVALEQDCNILDTMIQKFKKLHQYPVEKYLAFKYDLEKFYPELWQNFQTKTKNIERKYTALLLKKGIEQNMYRNDLNIEATAILLTSMTTFTSKDLMTLSMSNSQCIDYFLDMVIHMLCNENGIAYYLQTR